MRSNSGKPLGIYVHIPFCKSKCEYCDFYSLGGSRDRRTTDQYLQALADHIRETGRLAPDYTVDTVYFGGGTPSFFGAENLEKILDELQKRFHFGADPEITLEANPDSVTPQGLKRLVRAGFNRISIGVQSDQDDMLKRLGRPHTYEQARMAVVRAREAGFANLSLDLMFGLPNQTLTGWRDTLENVLRLKPEHMSCYALKVEPNTPLWEYRDCANLPNDDVQADMYLAASEILQDHGYEHYEISNFAKPGYECRHNIGYWKRVDYLGVGLGASSLIDNVRYSNTRDLYTYLSECENIHDCYMQYPLTEGVTGSAVYSADGTHILVPAVNLHAAAEQTTRNEQMEEFMFLGLRMRDGFYREEFTQAFGIPIEAVYGDALNHLQQEELLLKREGRIYLTDKGMDLNNYVVAQFML